ncbi:hypothetical protein [Paenibacillus polymyxa]|uniref:hypothetical protein n=1 Tax=Paenibacillus polymyxa TaxID=1406 RepID=UPI00287F614A|nr:hypothetical protein [Paenibacillus polymyxa]
MSIFEALLYFGLTMSLGAVTGLLINYKRRGKYMSERIEDHIKTEYIDLHVDFKLKKDIALDEEICKDCKGLGLHIYDARYGVTVNGKKLGNDWFPFNKQSISWCPSCYNGVRKRCKHCGELVPKQFVACQCSKALEERGKSPWQIEKKIWDKAEKITYKEALDKYDMLYVGNWDKYIMADELEEQIEYWLDDNAEPEDQEEIISDLLNLHIYGTNKDTIALDAEDIISDATSDLHDEAYERSKHVIEKLQNYLDVIKKEIEDTTSTYYQDVKIGVQLTLGDIKDISYIKSNE